MKVSKIEKITNEIDRTQNTIAQQTERLKKLQNDLLIARQEEQKNYLNNIIETIFNKN